MKKNVMMVNYLLSISLILLVIIFMVILMSMSRLILSDFNPVGSHLVNTQNLLGETKDVKDKAIDPDKISISEGDSLRLSYEGLQISDIAYINVNETRSIVTMFFNSEVGSVGDSIYYIKITDTSTLRNDELLVYEDEGIRIGEFVSLTDSGDYIILDSVETNVVEIKPGSVLGRAFFTSGITNDISSTE